MATNSVRIEVIKKDFGDWHLSEQAKEIYERREAGETYASIAERFGISPGRIAQIYFSASRFISNDKPRSITPNSYIDDMRLGCRTANVLANLGLKKVSELLSMTERELLRSKNFGRVSMAELQLELGRHGLSLNREDPEELKYNLGIRKERLEKELATILNKLENIEKELRDVDVGPRDM